ncbi:class III lanthipeptide [Mammaliicoccus sciuri]
MNKVLSLQKVSVAKSTELKAGSSLSVNCKIISTISVAVC